MNADYDICRKSVYNAHTSGSYIIAVHNVPHSEENKCKYKPGRQIQIQIQIQNANTNTYKYIQIQNTRVGAGNLRGGIKFAQACLAAKYKYTNKYKYIQIQIQIPTNTYKYIQIHTNTNTS